MIEIYVEGPPKFEVCALLIVEVSVGMQVVTVKH